MTEPIGPHSVPPSLFQRYLAERNIHKATEIAFHARRLARVWPAIARARELLAVGAGTEAVKDELARAGLTVGDQDYASRAYHIVYRKPDRIWEQGDRQLLRLHERWPDRAALGTPGFMGSDYFRSAWEKRTAEALARLGIPWTYEAERFVYQDKAGRHHRYTPDFRIDCLANTFVEVKGHAGADAADAIKMQRVLRRYPKLTLMLWDADIVEYVEDCSDPAIVLGLLNTTRIAA